MFVPWVTKLSTLHQAIRPIGCCAATIMLRKHALKGKGPQAPYLWPSPHGYSLWQRTNLCVVPKHEIDGMP